MQGCWRFPNKGAQHQDIMQLQLHLQAEDVLRENGAVMKEAFPMLPKVTVDRELITAQQPSSAVAFGEAFVKALAKA